MATSRRSWPEPGLRTQLMALMDAVFPGIAQVIGRARALGAAWEDVTTPFVASAEGGPVGQVSVMRFAMVLDGRPTDVGCLHAVCTHPAHRRRGHYASAMRAALADEILRRMPAQVRRVELFACPDALGMTVAAEPHVFVDGDDALGGAGAVRLMVRGPFPEGLLMLPRPFRC